MTKAERLAYLKERAKVRIPLSEKAAAILEQIKSEDSDLGGPASVGEVLPPERIERKGQYETEDENSVNTELISPSMRKVIDAEE